VLELVEGETLRARIDRGRLDVPAAVAIAIQIGSALAACHAEGVLHRDIKPDNVVLHPTRGAVLLDFSVAWFTAAATLTRTGASIGTPQYLAPEVLQSSFADARTDLYALGVVLFEMLIGRTPRSADPLDTLDAADQVAPAVFSLRPETGPALSAVVAQAIAPRAEDRYAMVDELIGALRGRARVNGCTLEARLSCERCGIGRIVGVPFCPGCGVDVAWSLSAGPAWLTRRHPEALAVASTALLERRLALTPVPLAIGLSSASAEQLASEAREAGATPVVIHTRRLGGPSIRAARATNMEMLSFIGAHFALTMGLSALLVEMGMRMQSLAKIPDGIAIVGIAAAILYTRRPLVRCQNEAKSAPHPAVARIRQALGELTQDRTRRLAAQAVSRAAPVLLGDLAGLPSSASATAIEALEEAVSAARAAEHHLVLLLESQLTEAAIAHDLEVRRALASSAHITDILSSRTR